MKNLNIIWTAVVSSLTGALAVLVALWGDPDVALALGAVSIASAILSLRENQ